MDKKLIVEQLLKNQNNYSFDKEKLIDEIEPFSWMDDQIYACLSTKLSKEEMEKMDRCARINIAGRKIMIRSFTSAASAALSPVNMEQ